MFALTLKSVRGRMRRAHRVKHVGTRVLCTVPPPRAHGYRSPIENRIIPRKIKETVLQSAPVSGKSPGPLLPHPSVDSLHRLVTSQMSPRTMGTQHKKVSVAHFHALRLHRGSVKRSTERKHVHIDELFYIPRARRRVGFDEVPRYTGPGELLTLVSAGAAHGTAQERTARAGVGDRQHARLSIEKREERRWLSIMYGLGWIYDAYRGRGCSLRN